MTPKQARKQLLAELLVEQFAPYGHNEWHQTRPVPDYTAVDDTPAGRVADVIRLDDRRAAA